MRKITREMMTYLITPRADPAPLLSLLRGQEVFFLALSDPNMPFFEDDSRSPVCFLGRESAAAYLQKTKPDRTLAPKAVPLSSVRCMQSFFRRNPASVKLYGIPPISVTLPKDLFVQTFCPENPILSQKAGDFTLPVKTRPDPSGQQPLFLFPKQTLTSNRELNRLRLFSSFPDVLEEALRKKRITAAELDQTLGFSRTRTMQVLNGISDRLSLEELQRYLAFFQLEPLLYLFRDHCPELREYLFTKTEFDRYYPVAFHGSGICRSERTLRLTGITEKRDARGYLYFDYLFTSAKHNRITAVSVTFPFAHPIGGWYRLDPL